ncbi:(R)-mandelonitrile lyase [Pseudonocardia phyllosphaerae]|uniref:(R)-mandelonitrile lyase n=1 Tax=Pseudonocardia phyllosphaerae TaxID=3390502 RepID=UPI003978BC9B
MQITRSSTLDTQQGPGDWFTGDVHIDPVASPAANSTVAAASVHFAPGARTAWHTHPHGQTIFVTEGFGACQREGGPVELIGPGDRVFFEPGENHWHGAAPNRFMVHTAIQQVDESGSAVTWGRHVSDDEYAAAQAS